MAIQNEPLAFHLCGEHSRRIRPCAGSGVPLPDTLVVPPGRYLVHGRSYELRREGLYRFLNPAIDNQQRIVHRDKPLALISALAWIASHGSRDHAHPREEWAAIAQREKLIITCGSISAFGAGILQAQGVSARVVSASTLAKLNTYDNGHVLLEAKLNGRWTLVDLDVKTMFRRGRRRLSLLEFAAAARTGDYTFERLAAATSFAVGCFVEEGYDYGLFMETAFCTEACLRRWYRRVMMVPSIRADGGRFACGTPAVVRTMHRLYGDKNVRFLAPAEFRSRFYGN